MNMNAPYHIGIDAHRCFSHIHVLDRDGQTAWKGRIDDNDPAAFAGLVAKLHGPCRAVFDHGGDQLVKASVTISSTDLKRVLRLRVALAP